MGIGQWTDIFVKAGSYFNKNYNIQPGEYWFMYDPLTRQLIIKDPKQNKIVYQKYQSSVEDMILIIDSSLPTTADLEIFKKLKRGGKSGTRLFPNHHIIPLHLWKDSQLIIKATDYGFDMNGPDNLMRMPLEIHKKCHDEHSKYSYTVRYHLKDRWNALFEAGQETNPRQIKNTLLSLIDALRENLKDIIKENGYMDDI